MLLTVYKQHYQIAQPGLNVSELSS